MTADASKVPDQPEPGKAVSERVAILNALETGAGRLPQPQNLTISHTGQISMHFGSRSDTYDLDKWAEQYGGTVTGSRFTSATGESVIRYEVTFGFHGVDVTAYAYVEPLPAR